LGKLLRIRPKGNEREGGSLRKVLIRKRIGREKKRDKQSSEGKKGIPRGEESDVPTLHVKKIPPGEGMEED